MSSNLSFYNTFKYYIKGLTTSTFLNPFLPISEETKKNSKEFLREKQRKKMILIKLKSKRFSRSSSKVGSNKATSPPQVERDCSEIKWEVRPGGMLVQKRESNKSVGEGLITIRVSTVSKWHDISIEATSTFGELKMILSLVTNLEPREQRLLFKGKERDDNEFLHMIGVKDKDKVLLLEDPAIKEKKLLGLARSQPINNPCCA